MKPHRRSRSVDIGQARRALHDLLFARLADARGRAHQVEIGRKRLPDQALQLRILKLAPPLREIGLPRYGATEGGLCRGGNILIGGGRWKLRFPVIGTDGACAEQHRERGREELPHAETASDDPCAVRAGPRISSTSGSAQKITIIMR